MTRLVCLLAGAAALALPLLHQQEARAAENGVAVSGQIELAPPDQLGEPPERGMAFVPRAKNALRPPRPMNPLPQCVVVLTDGPVADEDRKPNPAVEYRFIGESFHVPLLPVVVGSKVEVKNKSRRTPRLHSTAAPDSVPVDPINPKGVRATAPISKAYQPIDIRDHDSVHTVGHIVAFEHAYFTLPDPENGRFTITGVPPGRWSVRIWYRDGWVKMAEKTVDLQPRRGAKGVTLKLPAPIETSQGS